MSRMLTAAGGLIALALATLFITAAAPGAGTPTYLNSHASIDSRVNDLLRQMTLEEKVGQMDQIVIGKLKAASPPANGDCNGGNNDPLQPVCLEKVLIDDRTGLDPGRRHRQPQRQHRQGLGRAVQHHPALRHRALPAAHPDHLRGGRGARPRPPIQGHAVPPVDRDGSHLGCGAGRGRRPCHPPAAAGHRRELELRPGPGPCQR